MPTVTAASLFATSAAADGAITSAEIGDSTAPGRALLTAVDVPAQRTALGLGTLATKSTVLSADITDGTIVAADLAASGVTAAIYGSATQVAQVTVNAQGQTTLAANVAIAIDTAALASGTLAAARMPALTGDITTTAGAVATTLAVTGVTAASYGSASLVPVLTIDAKGRVTGASTAAVATTTNASLLTSGTLADARLSARHNTVEVITDWDAIVASGNYKSLASATTNAPEGTWNYYGITVMAQSNIGTSICFREDNEKTSLTTLCYRKDCQVTWGAWYQTNLSKDEISALIAAAGGGTNASALVTGTLAAARLPAFTGDVTTTAGSSATTLATSGVTANTYTYATVTFDAKGRATAASSGTAPLAASSLAGTGVGSLHIGTYNDPTQTFSSHPARGATGTASNTATFAAGGLVAIAVTENSLIATATYQNIGVTGLQGVDTTRTYLLVRTA